MGDNKASPYYGKGSGYRGTLAERFWPKVNKTSTCWLWTAATMRNGYGVISKNGKNMLAHHAILEIEGIDIPEGKVIDHLCRVRNCVNPEHLEIVTNAENVQRGLKGDLRTRAKECSQGHSLLDPSNYGVYSKYGSKTCLVCNRTRNRQAYAKSRNGNVRKYTRRK